MLCIYPSSEIFTVSASELHTLELCTLCAPRPSTTPAPQSTAGSPALTATIHYKSKPLSYRVTPSRRRICRPLIRKNYPSFAKKCVQNVVTNKAMVKTIGHVLTREVTAMCSQKFDSILRQKYKESMKFKFETVIHELRHQAPTLLALLQSCLKTKTPRANYNSIIAIVAAIICKHRNSRCSLMHKMISLIMYAGHSAKQVYQRLQKVGLCLSYCSTIMLVDRLGENFDWKVKEWQKVAEDKISVEQLIPSLRNDDIMIPFIGMEPSPSPSPPPSLLPPLPSSSYTSSSDNTSSPSATSRESSASMPDVTSSDEKSDEADTNISSQENGSGQVEVPMECGQSSEEVVAARTARSVNTGYKLVFDNIDKNVKPRHMRIDNQTRSLHYVQSYAVKDRVSFDILSNEQPTEVNVFDNLTTDEDYKSLKMYFSILISRLIVEFLPFFNSDYKGIPTKHIPHEHSIEMASKSEIVPLGILPKSEMNYEDMTEILEHYQTYIPSVNCEVVIPEKGAVQDRRFLTTLIGGDYLSVARCRGAQLIRSTSELTKHTLSGILPVAEDWHAKVCFMEVMWRRLYDTKSGMERGTLYQLRNLINRRNVKKDVKGDVNATEDFIEVVVTGYIICAAMSFLGMSNISDNPSPSVISHDLWMEDDSVREATLTNIASSIVNRHIDLATVFRATPTMGDSESAGDGTGNDGAADGEGSDDDSTADGGGAEVDGGDGDVATSHAKGDDGGGSVYDYTREVLSLGMLYLNFKDAVREGDGNRVMLAWKYFLLIFRSTGHKNYALEALTMLTQYFVKLPPNLAEQLKWSRFVNAHGFPGHNISADLHMEHMNRVVKTTIQGLGANKSEKAIVRAGKTVGSISEILAAFDDEAGVASLSGKHTDKSMLKDLQQIVKQLVESDVFDQSCGHKSFLKLKTNLIRTLSERDLKGWILNNFSKHMI